MPVPPRVRKVSPSRKLRFAHCSNCGILKAQKLRCSCGTETWIGLWDIEMENAVTVAYGEHGLGVYATKDIPAWTLVETFPVYLIPAEDYRPLGGKKLKVSDKETTNWNHMLMPWLNTSYKALALGNALLYNHNFAASCLYWYRQDNSTGRYFIDMFTAEDVKEGEELTISYGEDVWFPPFKDPDRQPNIGTLGAEFAHLKGHGVGNRKKR